MMAAKEKERAERTLYARTISLAYQEWHNNNVFRAEDLLNKTEHKYRDWEWQFVKKLCNSEKQTLRGHVGIPSERAGSFHPAGRPRTRETDRAGSGG